MAEELFTDAMPPAAAATPTGQMPGTPEFSEEVPTEEEQAQYDQFTIRALDFIGQFPREHVATLNNKDKPAYESVGELTYKIAKGVEAQAQAAGVKPSADVMFAAGEEIVMALMELGEAAGIFPFSQDSSEYDDVQAMAYAHAANVAANEFMQSPQYTPEVKDEAGSFFAQQVAQERSRGEVPDQFFDDIGNARAANNKLFGGV